MLMDEQERATQIARDIEDALQIAPELALATAPTADFHDPEPPPSSAPRFAVRREAGCLSCDPGACWECGHLFSGERIVIHHATLGERVISDRALHLLSHGIVRYKTKYVVRNEPVIVELDIDELAGYVDM